MSLMRPKQQTIYGTVHNWHQNGGGVFYIAHAIRTGNVVALGAVTSGTGGKPLNHPDQVFWRTANTHNWPAANTVIRIEIDCSLMPCDGQGGCLFAVPNAIQGGPYAGKELRIFSHRDENLGETALQNKRVFICHAGDNALTLTNAYQANENWFWVSASDPRVNNRDYSIF